MGFRLNLEGRSPMLASLSMRTLGPIGFATCGAAGFAGAAGFDAGAPPSPPAPAAFAAETSTVQIDQPARAGGGAVEHRIA